MREKLDHKKVESSAPELEATKKEHLAEGFRPIMACIGTLEQYGEDLSAIKDIEEVGGNVDGNPFEKLKEKGYKKVGGGLFVSSPVDEKSKFTKTLKYHVSLIAVGREVGSGKEISFLTNQFQGTNSVEMKDVEKILNDCVVELKKRCIPGSIDMVVAGGVVEGIDLVDLGMSQESQDRLQKSRIDYEKSLEALGTVVKEKLGFSPMVIFGPKNSDASDNLLAGPVVTQGDDVYFDTQNRRLYVVRPDNVFLHNKSFKADEVKNMKGEWLKEREEKSKSN